MSILIDKRSEDFYWIWNRISSDDEKKIGEVEERANNLYRVYVDGVLWIGVEKGMWNPVPWRRGGCPYGETYSLAHCFRAIEKAVSVLNENFRAGEEKGLQP